MLTLLRNVPYFQNRKYVLSNLRCINSSRRNPFFITQLNYEDPTSEKDDKKKGYGEKEICLLEKTDRRIPFPGRMGALPLMSFYTTTIQDLPTPVGDKWKTLIPSAQENYTWILAQYAANALKEIKSMLNKLDCQVHPCPVLLRKDFLRLFPTRNIGISETLTVVILCLKTEFDMSTWSEEAEAERERLTREFVFYAKSMFHSLKKMEFWCDFIDPSTGKPHSSPWVDDTMFETDLRYRNFGLKIEDLGCCTIVSHPIWGTNVFVGAIFTNAPVECFEKDFSRKKGKSLYSIVVEKNGLF